MVGQPQLVLTALETLVRSTRVDGLQLGTINLVVALLRPGQELPAAALQFVDQPDPSSTSSSTDTRPPRLESASTPTHVLNSQPATATRRRLTRAQGRATDALDKCLGTAAKNTQLCDELRSRDGSFVEARGFQKRLCAAIAKQDRDDMTQKLSRPARVADQRAAAVGGAAVRPACQRRGETCC